MDDGRIRMPDDPTGPCKTDLPPRGRQTGIAKQHPSAENRKPLCHDCGKHIKYFDIMLWTVDIWVCNRCFDERNRNRHAVKAVAVDTNEECENGSLPLHGDEGLERIMSE